MEDVLAVYGRPYDEQYLMVGMDEKPYQLLEDVREPLPVKPGHTEKMDNEYRRKGTSSIFMCTEPLGGWRQVEALPQRTKKDWTHKIQWLIDTQYSEAKKVALVYQIYNTAFRSLEYGYASVITIVLFTLVLGITLIQFRVEKRFGN
jgi:hypothetical protein